jgi:glutamyl-tRNA synthetase/nondiscriminating glutamyl-tRNA synthetase
MRLRFAPSPTGQLHVGNARTALFNWLLARGAGGQFILRIEDTDTERSTAASEQGILEDLRWLGLTWDEGPGVGGPHGPYRQSERLGLYRFYGDELLARERAYYCFCSAEQLEAERLAALAAGQPPRYSGRCRTIGLDAARRRMAAGQAAALRFRVGEGGDVAFDDLVRGRVSFSREVIGDPVILRSDGRPAYNFAVVVDDGLMKITHVIRGEDHVSNTPRQILMYEALDWTPPAFAHLALVMGPDHSPLSKRHGATSVREFRDRGYLPEALVNYLALLGWSPGGTDEVLPVEQLAARFRLEDVGKSAGVFDPDKLAWVNRHYLKACDPARLVALALPHLAREGWATTPDQEALDYLASILPQAAASVDRLEQVPDRLRFLFVFDPAASLRDERVRAEAAEPSARAVIEALAAELQHAPRLLDRAAFRAAAHRVRERTAQKGRALFHPIRLALTGEGSGMELDLAVPAIERGAASVRSGLAPILGARERATAFARAIA